MVWIASALMTSALWLTGIYPGDLVAMTALGSLVAYLAAGQVAGRIYRED